MTRKKGKRSSGNKGDRGDWSRYNKFREENEKLRKEVSRLRKIVQEVLVDRLEEKQNRIDKHELAIEITCEQCGNTNINKIPITRPDGKFEIISCNSCGNRGTLKRVKEKKHGSS